MDKVLVKGMNADDGHGCWLQMQVLTMGIGADHVGKVPITELCTDLWGTLLNWNLSFLALVSGPLGILPWVSLGRRRLVLCMKTKSTHRAYSMDSPTARTKDNAQRAAWLFITSLVTVEGWCPSWCSRRSLFAVRMTLVVRLTVFTVMKAPWCITAVDLDPEQVQTLGCDGLWVSPTRSAWSTKTAFWWG